jgi:hypothetical protein
VKRRHRIYGTMDGRLILPGGLLLPDIRSPFSRAGL